MKTLKGHFEINWPLAPLCIVVLIEGQLWNLSGHFWQLDESSPLTSRCAILSDILADISYHFLLQVDNLQKVPFMEKWPCNSLLQGNKVLKTDKRHFLCIILGPLHVLWQLSFGCWVTWSIPSWQEFYKSVFFFNFTKPQFLNDKIYSYNLQLFQSYICTSLSYTKKKLFVLVNFIIQKFARLKSKHFSQFFWWEVNLRGLREHSFCRKFRPQLLRDRKKSSATHYSPLGK